MERKNVQLSKIPSDGTLAVTSWQWQTILGPPTTESGYFTEVPKFTAHCTGCEQSQKIQIKNSLKS